MSTFTNSATLLINTNNKVDNTTNAIYSQVFQSPARTNNKKSHNILLCQTDNNPSLIDSGRLNSSNKPKKPNAGNLNKSRTDTSKSSSNDTFTSKLPPVPRRNSKNMLIQNSNSNLNLLTSSHNSHTNNNNNNADSVALNSLSSLNRNKHYQKI